jgi:energy-coupling factor transport system permease protein
LLALPLLLIGVFAGHSLVSATVGAGCALMLAVRSQAGWNIWVQALGRFRWMLGLTAAINLFVGQGDTPVVLAGQVLPFTEEALRSGAILTIQLTAAIILSMTLTFTTTPHELTKGCERLAKPLKRLKVPVEDLALVSMMAMRFVPLFQQELRNIVDAQKARGVDFGTGSLIARVHNVLPVLVPAIVGTLRRGERLASAMASRGFRPGEPRSAYNPLHFGTRDWACLCLAIIFSLAFVLLAR